MSSSAVSSHLARRYAQALLDLSVKDHVAAQIDIEMTTLREGIALEHSVEHYLASPLLRGKAAIKLAEEISDKAGLHALTKRFLLLLAKNGRFAMLSEVAHFYTLLLQEHEGIVQAEVVSAATLTQAQREALAQTLKSALGKEINLHTTTDATLLGGFKLHVAGMTIDSTLALKLNRLRSQLIQAA